MPEFASFHHVKLPVSSLQASKDWLEQVLGLRAEIEFIESGELRLARVDDRGTCGWPCGSTPDALRPLAGFDILALAVPSRDGVRAWDAPSGYPEPAARWRLTGHNGGTVLVGLHMPDGHEIRLYAD
jgi:catechol 2,3-dioxygenase-like lactoylglutathione lyase family enzyme